MSFDPPLLGPRLQQIRKKRKLTLDDLAALSGVSRSMLSQIERGQTNPTFATLWNLTRALGLDLSALVEGHSGSARRAMEIVPRHFTPEIRSEDGRCVLRILSPAANSSRMEWYELEMAPGGALISDPHAPGATEHLTVLDGILEVRSGAEENSVGAGATARYAVDVPHAIHNRSDRPARALMIVAMADIPS